MHFREGPNACRYGDKFVVYLLPDDQDQEAQEDGKQKILLQVCSRASATQGQLQGQLHRVHSLETLSCLELTKFETMGRCNNPSRFLSYVLDRSQARWVVGEPSLLDSFRL